MFRRKLLLDDTPETPELIQQAKDQNPGTDLLKVFHPNRLT
jgi:hypothetical protein